MELRLALEAESRNLAKDESTPVELIGEIRGRGDKGPWSRIVGTGSSEPRVGEGSAPGLLLDRAKCTYWE